MLVDQIDLLRAFNAHKVRYLTVGGHAVGLYSEPRGTKDLDVVIACDEENAQRVYAALAEFGAPLTGVTPADFTGNPTVIFQLGVPPARVDVLQQIDGVPFEEAWERRVPSEAAEDTPMFVISRDDLITNKLASGRLIDLADVERIRAAVKATAGEG